MKKLNLFIFLTVLFFQHAAAQTPAVAGSNTFLIDTRKVSDTIIVPLKIDQGKLVQVVFATGHPVFVRNGSYTGEQIRSGITIPSATAGGGLVVILNSGQLTIPGDYDVNVAYQLGNSSGLLNFTLHREPAVIDPVTVNVSHIGHTVHSDQVVLTETGNKAGAVNIRISDPDVPWIKSGKLITFPKKPLSVGSSGRITVPLVLNDTLFDDLPLGDYQAKSTVTGGGLAAPVTIQFVIRNRRCQCWIIGMVLAGLGFGYLLRIVLQGGRDYEQAKLNGLALLRDIWTFTHPVKDADFLKKVSIIATTLQQAIDIPFSIYSTNNLTKLNTAISTAQNDFNTQKSGLDTRLAAAKSLFDALKMGLFNYPHEKVLADRLDSVAATLQLAVKKLDESDAVNTNQLVNHATQQAISGLEDWVRYSRTFVNFLQGQTQFMPAADMGTIPAELTTTVTTISADLQAITLPMTDPVAAIKSADAVQKQLQDLVSSLENTIMKRFEALSAKAAADPNFISAFSQWTNALADMAINPQLAANVSVYWLPQLKTTLDNSWTSANEPAAVTRMGTAKVNQGAPAYQFTGRMQAFANKVVPVFNFTTNQLEQITRSYAVVSSLYRKQTIIQTLCLAILITAGLFAGYYQNFVGTWSDLINIFLFAFSLDATVTGIAQIKGKSSL